jgi:hypothetical protein
MKKYSRAEPLTSATKNDKKMKMTPTEKQNILARTKFWAERAIRQNKYPVIMISIGQDKELTIE